jgi:hypothetical protein
MSCFSIREHPCVSRPKIADISFIIKTNKAIMRSPKHRQYTSDYCIPKAVLPAPDYLAIHLSLHQQPFQKTPLHPLHLPPPVKLAIELSWESAMEATLPSLALPPVIQQPLGSQLSLIRLHHRPHCILLNCAALHGMPLQQDGPPPSHCQQPHYMAGHNLWSMIC